MPSGGAWAPRGLRPRARAGRPGGPGRRTLLRTSPEPSPRRKAVREAPVAPALAAATGAPEEALALLERLDALLKPTD
nr:hypothetical protein OG999_34060 [Streptomyces sp. NBC_00886]